MPRVLLASRSPRRRAMLDAAGINHKVVDTGLDDAELDPGSAPVNNPAAWVTALAYLKANAALPQAMEGDVVLAADTTCVLDGRVIGTPRDENHAASMILGFMGRNHDVLTGLCVLAADGSRRILCHDRAVVTLGFIPMRDLSAYIASGEWRGKAGGYNFTQRVEAGWPLEVRGDPETVVGLPMRLVRSMLRQHADVTRNAAIGMIA